MKKYLANAISLNMFPQGQSVDIHVKPIQSEDIPKDIVSAVGHKDTAKVIESLIGFEVIPQRINVALEEKDELYVAQYIGPRLQEGATCLPEGAKINFLKITFKKN